VSHGIEGFWEVEGDDYYVGIGQKHICDYVHEVEEHCC